MKRANRMVTAVAAAAVAVGGFGLAGWTPAARAETPKSENSDPGRQKDPGTGTVTGTSGDLKGTSERIGGRDLPPTDPNKPERADAKADAKASDAKADAKTSEAKADAKVDAVANAQVNEADLKAVRRFLAETTETAVAPNSLDKVVARLHKEDRDRINADTAKVDTADLDKAVADFRQNWKAKYGRDFDIADDQQAVVFADVTPGAVMADVRTASEKIKADAAGAKVDEVVPGKQRDPGDGKVTGTSGDLKGTANRIGGRDLFPGPTDPSRAVATLPDQFTIKFPESHGLKVVHVPVVREGTEWRIDAPDRLSKGELRNNLVQHLNQLNGAKDKWPADVNDAYAAVAHHFLLAIDDTGVGARPTNAVDGPKAGQPDGGPGR